MTNRINVYNLFLFYFFRTRLMIRHSEVSLFKILILTDMCFQIVYHI